jgi:hypothetical protein
MSVYRSEPCLVAVDAARSDCRSSAGVWLQWRTSGSSGIVERPPVGGPMKSYVRCIRHQGYENMYGKTIANSFWLKKASNAHSFMYRCVLRTYFMYWRPTPCRMCLSTVSRVGRVLTLCSYRWSQGTQTWRSMLHQ